MTDAATGTRSLVMEREFTHAPEKVWRALTEGPLLEEWLMKNDFAPVVGHRFTFRADPSPQWNGVIEGEVLEVIPPERLVYRWYSWVVTWTLEPTANGVRVRMEQAGFGPDQDAAYKGATYGWNKFLGQLDAVLGRLD